jgi:rhamnose utilization protein RhaD (predicted bifunctional aldolase and dehydrogenase)
MKSLWSDSEAKKCKDDLDLRVYTSRLLGIDSSLVLHGGGNTSVKIDDALYVKGSGWDLATIEREGFSAVLLEALQEMAKLDKLSDSDMVKLQRESMLDKKAPNPSVEAILHAIIPFKFVDHTHADAIVTISNSKNGKEIIDRLYSDFLILPYIMPGFILAHEVYLKSKEIDWDKCGGIILHNHGIFTFANSAKESYERMIEAVSRAEEYLEKNAKIEFSEYLYDIEELTRLISHYKSHEVVCRVNRSKIAALFANQEDVKELSQSGILTPEHILRTKRFPLYLEDNNFKERIEEYIKEYESYFNRYKKDEIMLNPAPNWAVLKGFTTLAFGKSEKEAKIIEDINNHTMEAILRAKALGGYESIGERESFEMEYWELEQAKLKK